MYNKIKKLAQSHKKPRAKIRSGHAFSGDWYDIIKAEKDAKGNEWYQLYIGNSFGVEVTRWHIIDDLTIDIVGDVFAREQRIEYHEAEIERIRQEPARLALLKEIRKRIRILQRNGSCLLATTLQIHLTEEVTYAELEKVLELSSVIMMI